MHTVLPALVHRMRALPAALPRRLHRDGSRRSRVEPGGCARGARERNQRLRATGAVARRTSSRDARATVRRIGRQRAGQARGRGRRGARPCAGAPRRLWRAPQMIAGLRHLVLLGAIAMTTPCCRAIAGRVRRRARRAVGFRQARRLRAALSGRARPMARRFVRRRTKCAPRSRARSACSGKFDDGERAARHGRGEAPDAAEPTCACATCSNAVARSIRPGAPQRAVPLFAEALTLAERDRDEYYAVDAAHMLGIAAPPAERLGWNLKALALAEAATDPRARGWRASLYNNIGWAHFDDGDAKAALDYWQKALARARVDGQRRLDARREVDGRPRLSRRRPPRRRRGGAEEPARRVRRQPARPTATCTRSSPRSRSPAATRKPRAPWAAKAHAALKDDPHLAANEAPRLARLAAIAAGNPPPAAKP